MDVNEGQKMVYMLIIIKNAELPVLVMAEIVLRSAVDIAVAVWSMTKLPGSQYFDSVWYDFAKIDS